MPPPDQTGPACCDTHGPNCEPPSELCCDRCSEVGHPFHADGTACTWASDADVAFGQAVQRLAGNGVFQREQWAATCRWLANQSRSARVEVARDLDEVADMIERGDITPWADTLEPASPPAQQPHDAPAGDGGHPGTPYGPAVLGRALLEDGRRVTGFWPADLGSAWPKVLPVLLVRPEVGRVLEAAREWRAGWDRAAGYFGGDWAADCAALVAAVDAATDEWQRRTTGGPDHDGLTGAPLHPDGSPCHCRSCPHAPIAPLPGVTDEERAAFLAEVEHRGSPCWLPGAHGQPVCVREIGKLACPECPTPYLRTAVENATGTVEADQQDRPGDAIRRVGEAIQRAAGTFAGFGETFRQVVAARAQAEQDRLILRAVCADEAEYERALQAARDLGLSVRQVAEMLAAGGIIPAGIVTSVPPPPTGEDIMANIRTFSEQLAGHNPAVRFTAGAAVVEALRAQAPQTRTSGAPLGGLGDVPIVPDPTLPPDAWRLEYADGQRLESHVCRWKVSFETGYYMCGLYWSDGERCDARTTDSADVRRTERLVGPSARGGIDAPAT